MTTLAHRLELRGPRNGGVAARRAVVRWAWRLFRREWRRQILVTALLTVAVAAAIGSVTIAYNSGAADDAKHGSASYLLRFDGTDQRTLGGSLDSARDWFGTIDVIGHRSFAVPGDVETVEFRSQDPRGAFGSALLALRRGTYPVGPRQIAVTDGVADLLALQIGEALALDGRRRTVVGIVENPRDLSDEFALVSPGSAGALDNVTVLVDAGDGSIDAFRQSLDRGADGRSAFAGSAAPPARHARRGRCDAETPSARAADQRRRRRRDRRSDRDGRGSRPLVCGPPDARDRVRPSHRPAQSALDAARDGRPRRSPRGNRRRLVARASGRPRPCHARPLGATA